MASLVLFNYTQHRELWAPAQQCGGKGRDFPPPYLPYRGQMAFLHSAVTLPAITWTLSSQMTEGRRSCQGNNLMVLISCTGLIFTSNCTHWLLSMETTPPCLDKFPWAVILSFWACWKQVACLCDDPNPAITLVFCPVPPQRCSYWTSPDLCFWVYERQCAQEKHIRKSTKSLGYSAFLGVIDRICWPWRSIREFG